MPRNVRILELPRQSGAVRISSSLVRCLDKLRQALQKKKKITKTEKLSKLF